SPAWNDLVGWCPAFPARRGPRPGCRTPVADTVWTMKHSGERGVDTPRSPIRESNQYVANFDPCSTRSFAYGPQDNASSESAERVIRTGPAQDRLGAVVRHAAPGHPVEKPGDVRGRGRHCPVNPL